MRKFIYLLIYFMLISVVGQAQHDHSRCGHNHIMSYNEIHHPLFTQKTDQIEEFTKKWIATNSQQARSGTVLQIPVVIHVVWHDSIENISDAQIQSQLDVLNEDFRKRNADTTFIPTVFQPLAADIEIEFVLAKKDTLGLPTTGINRIQTTINEFGNFNPAALAAVPPWDTASYMNLYVCEITEFGGILGYATSPGSPFGGFDGIVIDYRYFGTTGTVQAPFDLGRTLTHEVGHYLNLRHIWGNSGGCADDDLVNDTPSQDFPNYGCNVHPLNSCGSADMFMNYMDYGDDPCLVMFTQDQKMRMLAALNGPRAGLLTSSALDEDGTILYVDETATGLNTGDSWANAFTELTDAFNTAQARDTIWVAQGTYLPNATNLTRNTSFNIPDSVKIYGGFNGTETELNQREPEIYSTILSGDVNGDDIDGDLTVNRLDNLYNIMTIDVLIDNEVVIDGFIFQGGYSNNGVINSGGAILSYGSPVIVECVFRDNYAQSEGGAVSFIGSTGFEVEYCFFSDNKAGISGGAFFTSDADGTILDSFFDLNESDSTGGALAIRAGEVSIEDCIFIVNESHDGGAISSVSTPTSGLVDIINSDFLFNHANNGGGCVAAEGAINIIASIFDGNTSGVQGGALMLSGEDVAVTNSLITYNTVGGAGLGGGIYVDGIATGTDVSIINCTVANNQGVAADGIYHDNSASAKIYIGNTILSNSNLNYAADIVNTEIISWQGNLSNDNSLINILTHIADRNNMDPKFADTTNFDFHLQQGSPAQDIGVTVIAPLYDLDSLERVGFSDAGAYEYPFLVSTEEQSSLLNKTVKVYPNPPIDRLTIEINNDWTGTINYQLIDMSGKVLKVWNSDKYNGVHQEQMNIQDLGSGLYQVLLTHKDGHQVVRFIKL